MTSSDMNEHKTDATGSAHEEAGDTNPPQGQTPDKPSQAEGDRETIDASIEEKVADSVS